ncbi:MAG: phosphoribosyltransferase [Candidatus Latescibacteria bacterium]|nr:phosphoribosyltransferase [Candidatus Latescibacterota bacterium]
MFRDRKEAGEKLAEALQEKYAGGDTIVLAIPRGGAEVGYQVALNLNIDFSLIISKKLPNPDNPETGFGAIAEEGKPVILRHAALHISELIIHKIVQQQREEIRRRVEVLRKGNPLPDISGRAVILVDDGLAMGSTMRAAINTCRKKDAGRVVVAVPVSGPRAASEIEKLSDDTVILEIPKFYRAVAQVYYDWYDVPDEEVLEIIDRAEDLSS